MKTKVKKLLSFVLVCLMLFGIMPAGIELPTKAQAAGVPGYNAVAAVEWAKAHVNDTWSCLYGRGYWEPGTGDCANFVSQCIYMGGVDQTDKWNHSGYLAHYSANSDGSWIRATQLHDYVVSIGGQDIVNPSVSQISPGDLIFYKSSPKSNGYAHSAIVIDVSGGKATVAAHTTNYICYTNDNFHLGFSGASTHLVKMYGGTCTDKKVRDFTVYTAGSDSVLYAEPSVSSKRYFGFYAGEYTHVTETKNVNGELWGYAQGYGANTGYKEGWVKISTLNYIGHQSTGPISHLMGDWYVKVQPTCSTKGVEERVCSRCGYTEQRYMSIGGAHKEIIPATCLESEYCAACGEILSDPLGHKMSGWIYDKEPTCLEKGTEKNICLRCGYKETRECDELGHDFTGYSNLPGCTTSGTSYYKCGRCDYSYMVNSEWTAYSLIDPSDSKYSEFIGNPDLSKSRTEYRYRDKRYITSSSSSLSGWTKYNTTYKYSSYGSTQGPVYKDPGSGELRKSWSEKYVSDYEKIHYYRYSRYETSDGSTGNDTYLASKNWTNYTYLDLTYKLTHQSSTKGEPSNTPGYMVFYESSNYNDSSTKSYKTYWFEKEFDKNDTSKPIYSTRWYYQDRTKIYTYYYWQWGNWSSWSTSKPSSSSDRQIETRTTYSFKQGALGHDWGDPVVVAPTCHDDGYTRRTCKRCGVTMDTNVTKALGDLFGEWYLISDENASVKVYRRDCVRNCGCHCGCYETKTEEAECVYKPVQTVAPTCTEDGYTVYACTIHQDETRTDDIVPALGHEPDNNWYITKVPACTEKGEEECKCVRHDGGITCDKTFTRETDAYSHSMTKTSASAPTCLNVGNSEYWFCDRCNKYFSDENGDNEIKKDSWIIPATGHKRTDANGEENWITELEASCGTTGLEVLYCQNDWCDVTQTCANCETEHHYLIDEREIEEIAPDYEIIEHKNPTCIELGYDIWSCKNCIGTDHEHGWTDIINLAPHQWGEPEITYAACTSGGLEKITCSYCGLVDITGTDEATGHAKSPLDSDYNDSDDKMELISSVKNVCGDGTVDTYRCTHIDKNTNTRCDYTVTIGEANDHTLGDYIVTKEPSCTETGLRHKECINGDYSTEDEIIPATGHDYKEEETVPPTCVKAGYVLMVCANDSSHRYEKYTSQPLGHEYGEWYVVIPATYESTGLLRRDCIRHDVYETREIPMKIRHKATFIADDKIIGVVEFEDGATSIDEPAVPEKDRYTAKWEDYVLADKDITIYAEYSLIPPDGSSQIKTDKTASFDPVTGDAVITLSASSDAKTVISKTVKGKPLDIVLVVDQSGSMEGARTQALKKSANEFISAVNENAKEIDTDHRMAIVGFAMGKNDISREYYAYLNTGILTTGRGFIQKNRLTNSDIKNSLVSVRDSDGKVNEILTSAVNSIQAKGATAADLGLETANDIFSMNISDGRKRVIVFMTDGDPTYNSDFQTEVANSAIKQANIAKNANNAVIYGINIENYRSERSKNFIKYVSSNYPDASSFNYPGSKLTDKYYLEAQNTSSLSSIFETIAEETFVNTTDFKDVTLIDTVSKYFTLTTEQEKTLKESAVEKLGVKYSDITVTRNDDGTTVIRIDHVMPTETTVNGKTKFIAELSFTVTANENTLESGIYNTNTDDAGILFPGADSYEKTFVSPNIRITEGRAAAVFRINSAVFNIVNVKAGSKIKAPEFNVESGYTFSGWDVPENFTLDGGYVIFDSTLTRAKHTVTWIIDSKETSETLNVGDRITAPDVTLNSSGMEFAGWDADVPDYMPDSDLTFTALFADHEHKYSVKSEKKASCTENGEIVYECEICAETYSETLECTGHHNYYAVTGPSVDNDAKTSFICSECGEYLNSNLIYKLVGTRTDYRGNTRSVTYDIRMTDESQAVVQPDGSVTVSAVLNGYYPDDITDIKVKRYNDDSTYTLLPCTVKDGIVTFTTDHFCTFEFVIPADCEDRGRHEDYDKDGICDKCGKAVTKADLFRCSMCPKYEQMKDIPVIGIIYSVIHFFIHLASMISHIS